MKEGTVQRICDTRQLPAMAQTPGGVFGFLFGIIDLITSLLSLFDLLRDFFGLPSDGETA